MHPRLFDLLSGLTRPRGLDVYVFHRYANLARDLQRIGDRANVPRVTVHAFRHTFVSRLLESGASVADIRDLVGHANIALTVEIYGHLTQDHLARTTAKLPDFEG